MESKYNSIFSTLALYSWLRIIFSIKQNTNKKPTWEPIVGILSVAIAVHFHYQAVIIIPFALFISVYSFIKQKGTRKYWITGFSIAFLTLIPYLIGEIENNWKNTLSIINYFTGEHSRYYDRVSKPAYFLTFLPSFIERVVTGKNFPLLLVGRSIFFLGGIAFFTKAIKKIKKSPIHFWLGIYFLTLIIMLRLYKGDKLDYYLSTLYIFPIFLISYLINKYKKLFFIFMLFVIFQAGFFYGNIEKVDGYNDLKIISSFIYQKTEGREAKYLFYNDDDINTFSYGFKKMENLKANKDSSLLIEVCDLERYCLWNNDFTCRHSKYYTYSGLMKTAGEYSNKEVLRMNSGKIILIGELKKKPENLNYKIYSNDLGYGNNYLDFSLYGE